uniref:Putative secreted protein n=1 Tax=Xenopsylla cheopis TaxID=163159 RepID=A0A6M2E1W4_XENCH
MLVLLLGYLSIIIIIEGHSISSLRLLKMKKRILCPCLAASRMILCLLIKQHQLTNVKLQIMKDFLGAAVLNQL